MGGLCRLRPVEGVGQHRFEPGREGLHAARQVGCFVAAELSIFLLLFAVPAAIAGLL
jgi:hypothetical protein